MSNLFQEKRKRYLKWAAIIVLACLICFFLVWYFSWMSKIKSPPPQKPQSQKSLTPEEIQEILNRKAPEGQKNPVSPEEIQKILNKKSKKTSKNQKGPLSPEEIQKILNKKAK